ncbi:hypothetical protein pb186bvf_012741 [Paramecium bursaria]
MQQQQILEILGGFLQSDEPSPQLCDVFSAISSQTAKDIFNLYILDFIRSEDDHKSAELIICFFQYWISDEYLIELLEESNYSILIDVLQVKHYQSPILIDLLAKKIKSAGDQIIEFQLQSILVLMKADKPTADQIYNRDMKIIQEQFLINDQNIFSHYIQTQLLGFSHFSTQQKAKLDKIINLIEEKSKPIQPDLQYRIQCIKEKSIINSIKIHETNKENYLRKNQNKFWTLFLQNDVYLESRISEINFRFN